MDKNKKSIWSAETEISSFPSLDGDKKTDVLIIGGGIAGIMLAHRLEEMGIDYILVEAKKICSGITKDTTAKITAQHGLIYQKLYKKYGRERTEAYLNANLDALNSFESMSKNIDCDFEFKDSFVYSKDNKAIIECELKALLSVGYNTEYISSLPIPLSTSGAVKFKKQAQFNPLKFLKEISKTLKIYENTRVYELGKKRAITDKGTIFANDIVITTHFPFLNKHGLYPLKMYQYRSYVLGIQNAPDYDGIFVDEADSGLSFRNYKNHLLLGGAGHRTGENGGGWRELEAFAKEEIANSYVTHKWATQDCITLDGIPYIGKYSKGTNHLYVSTGFNKWGMTTSMVSAKLISDVLIGCDNPCIELYSPSRSILNGKLFINGFKSIKNLLTPTAPRCTHLGCALKYNKEEHSFDCPCHGSRFDEKMQVIDNPATDNIKKKGKMYEKRS